MISSESTLNPQDKLCLLPHDEVCQKANLQFSSSKAPPRRLQHPAVSPFSFTCFQSRLGTDANMHIPVDRSLMTNIGKVSPGLSTSPNNATSMRILGRVRLIQSPCVHSSSRTPTQHVESPGYPTNGHTVFHDLSVPLSPLLPRPLGPPEVWERIHEIVYWKSAWDVDPHVEFPLKFLSKKFTDFGRC